MPGTSHTLTPRWRRWTPLLTGICLVGLTLIGWQALERHRQNELSNAASVAGGWMAVAVTRDLQARIATLEKLAERWPAGYTPDKNRPGIDSLIALPGFQTLGWVDESHTVLQLNPVTSDGATPPRALATPSAIIEAAMSAIGEQQHLTVSEPFLLDNGKPALAFFARVEQGAGLLMAELELADWLDSLLLGDTRGLTYSRVLLQDQQVYEHTSDDEDTVYGPPVTNLFSTYALSWSIQVRSSNWPLARMNSIFSTAFLVLSLLLSGITAWFVRVKLKSAEQAGELFLNTQQLKSLWKSLPGMVFRKILRDKGNQSHMGEGCLTLSGYEKAEFERGSILWEDIINPNDRALRQEQIAMANASSPNYFAEYRISCKDKRLKWVLERGRMTFDKLGNKTIIDGLVIDATPRKQTETALIEAEGYAQAIVDTAAEAVITIDELGVIESFNRAAETMFGYCQQAAIGMEVTQLMPEHYRRDHQGHVDQHVAEAGTVKHISGRELTGKRKDGTIFPIQLSISAFQGQQGRRFVGLLRDLSVQRAAEQEARVHRGRLAHIDRVNILGEMATGIAHEINQPLSAISMYAQSCLRYLDAGNPKPDRLHEALEKLSQQAHRAGAVIEHMQQFARQRDSDREQFDCNNLIRQVVTLADSEAVMRNIDMVLDLDAHPCCALGDVVQIEQVILNLLRNGMESMESVNCQHGRQISLSTRCDGDTLTVAVSDSGTGVSAESADILFQPFKSTKKMGMGVGLTICQSIVQAHGGELGFSNNKDHGATFQFTLPNFSTEKT
ncbi:PAS domain-containing sensor histidine kinase [Granulosicoccus antarcticus]|uniref:histidine kinase n=1 Tax=Granulosicoccus antarcticus IMCC3135 TaxID=1192854 RepID=A0A2Z2NZ32_9GAMM|nr:PAS domain-containing sensor histidine kinase [Granulosicoccus antarcticus]ASJ76569.1 Sensor protein FixL [Granulosicoccus antarcticus IMCC3135]